MLPKPFAIFNLFFRSYGPRLIRNKSKQKQALRVSLMWCRTNQLSGSKEAGSSFTKERKSGYTRFKGKTGNGFKTMFQIYRL